MADKVTKLVKGAVVGIVADIFAVAALVYLLHSLAWGIWALLSDDANYVWVGYLIVAGLVLVLGRIRASLARRFVKGGSPPTRVMAIEPAHLMKQTIQSWRPVQPTGVPADGQA